MSLPFIKQEWTMRHQYLSRFRIPALAAVAAFGVAVSASAQTSTVIIAPSAPPPPRVETMPPPPATTMSWQAGHWAWNGTAWSWEEGHYVQAPQPSAVWEPGHWAQQAGSGGYVWVDGHWRS
jgi:hypothetical protein